MRRTVTADDPRPKPVATDRGAAVLFHLLWRHELDTICRLRCTRRRDHAGGELMAIDRPVLRPGDTVHFDGEDHQVVGLAGTSVRLRRAWGEQIILADI